MNDDNQVTAPLLGTHAHGHISVNTVIGSVRNF